MGNKRRNALPVALTKVFNAELTGFPGPATIIAERKKGILRRLGMPGTIHVNLLKAEPLLTWRLLLFLLLLFLRRRLRFRLLALSRRRRLSRC